MGIFAPSVEIMNSLVPQIFTSFSKLDIEKVVSHSKEECCAASLTEGEIFMLHEEFSLRSTFSDITESSLY